MYIPYYPAYTPHPLNNMYPSPPSPSPFPCVKYKSPFITRRRSRGVIVGLSTLS